MMQVVAHPRYAPTGAIRLWVGVRPVRRPPQLRWTLNGASAAPTIVRDFASVRSADLLLGDPARVFSGIFEFTGLPAGKSFNISVVGDDSPPFRIVAKTLPEGLPAGVDEWFNILLVSCYHHATSPKGALAAVMEDIRKACPPGLTLLIGDQVYLDLPTIKDFPSDRRLLAERFEVDYARNWFDEGGFRAVLQAAPSVAIPDDHEYWNNFPHASPIIQNAWTAAGRASWTVAARKLFEGFQTAWPRATGQEVIVDLPPISIFMADSRTFRRADRSQALDEQVLSRLGDWVTRLNKDQGIGVFVTGQSIFDPATRRLSGAVGDRTLANYGDFTRLLGHLSRATSPLMCITGDVHWGRVIQVRDDFQASRLAMYEIITSPLSLVESVGVDQVKSFVETIRELVGRSNPWPLHSPPEIEDVAWRGQPASRFQCRVLHGQTGNQVAVLALRRFGNGIQARVGYFAVHPQLRRRTQSWSQPFDLVKGIPDAF